MLNFVSRFSLCAIHLIRETDKLRPILDIILTEIINSPRFSLSNVKNPFRKCNENVNRFSLSFYVNKNVRNKIDDLKRRKKMRRYFSTSLKKAGDKLSFLYFIHGSVRKCISVHFISAKRIAHAYSRQRHIVHRVFLCHFIHSGLLLTNGAWNAQYRSYSDRNRTSPTENHVSGGTVCQGLSRLSALHNTAYHSMQIIHQSSTDLHSN